MKTNHGIGAPKELRLIPIHRRRYCMVNPAGKPQFLYDEELPSFYVPACEEVWLRLPEYLATKLGMNRHSDGHAYVDGSTLRKAEENLERLNKRIEDLMVPLIKSKVIFYRMKEDELEFSYSVRLLVEHVHTDGRNYWHMETPDENKLNDADGWDKPKNIVPWSPETEAWFEKVKKQIDELRDFVFHAMLLPGEDGRRWRRIQPEDILMMVKNNTSPLPVSTSSLLLEEGKGEKP